MLNIGEISKPSVSESPVKPRRSTSDSELATAVDSVGNTVKVASPVYPKHTKSKQKNKKQIDGQVDEALSEGEDFNNEALDNGDVDKDEVSYDDTSYDEKGHLSHHGHLDISA